MWCSKDCEAIMFPARRPRLFLLIVLFLIPRSEPAIAQWSGNGSALSTADNSQWHPAIASDGAGGAIVTWQDERVKDGVSDIYAQHVLASGTVDPAWPADGRAICTAAFNQDLPRIVADGAGGAIIIWEDNRSDLVHISDIYAQHVQASGKVDPAWPADGRALCTAAGDQGSPTIISDSAGGAIVTWSDLRIGNFDIYAQRVLNSGAVDPAWPANGRALCTAANAQEGPTLVADGAGGAIVTWKDNRNGIANSDIFAQHVLNSGAADPAWPANGRALCTAANEQAGPVIVS